MESARSATLVLAAPKAACDFLSERGARTNYLPAGLDTQESYSSEDVAKFQALHRSDRPFVLVLGRKAGAKNYRDVIAEVERFNRLHGALDVVLIGPDEDGLPLESEVAIYLGRQPRDVVRGALLSCMALANLSSSESFGIVLVEAWLAGRPVVVNRECAAFRDMAVHEWNALLVQKGELADALLRLRDDPALRRRLAANGLETAEQFDSEAVAKQFVAFCSDTIARTQQGEPSAHPWRRSAASRSL
jgi:glycosyltransferase involved in cell wall biosynthesis